MPTVCCVAVCRNHSDKRSDLSFHRVTLKNPQVFKSWLKFCRRGKEEVELRNVSICSEHFRAEDYVRDLQHELLGLPPRRKLKPDAAPSIYDPGNAPSPEEPTRRDERMEIKKRKEIVEQLLRESALNPTPPVEPPPPPPCLICSSSETVSCTESYLEQLLPGGDSSTSTSLNVHLWSIFVLRNLLDYPRDECEQLLQKMVGVHPGDWYRLCASCSQLVLQCSKVHQQIAQLQEKIVGFRNQAYKKLRLSFNTEIGIKTEENAGVIMCARDAVREYFKAHLPSAIKQEEIAPAEEDWNFEDSNFAMEYELGADTPMQDPLLDIPEKKPIKRSKPRYYARLLAAMSSTSGKVAAVVKPKKPHVKVISREERRKQILTPREANDGPKTGEIPESRNSVRPVSAALEETMSRIQLRRVPRPRKKETTSTPKTKTPRPKPPPKIEKTPRRRDRRVKEDAPPELVCPICKFRAPNQKSFDNHAGRHETNPDYCLFSCDKCPFRCSIYQPNYRYKHIDKHKLEENFTLQPPDRFSCNLCSEVFPTRVKINLHLRSSHGTQLGLQEFKCSKCGKQFSSNLSLRVHNGSKKNQDKETLAHQVEVGCWGRNNPATPETGVECKICHRWFTLDYYPEHLKRHETSKGLVCPICKYRAPTQKSFESHAGRHETNPDYGFYQCDKCPFRCSVYQRSLKSIHIAKHKLEDNVTAHQGDGDTITFSCNLCPEVAPTRVKINLHLRSAHGPQLGLQEFRCTTCGKTFSSKLSLRLHNGSVHSARKKRFPCDSCGTRFFLRYQLAYHTRVFHSDGVKPDPLICDLCGKAFATRGGLDWHKKYRHRMTPEEREVMKLRLLRCSHCGFQARHTSILKSHLKEEHPDVYTLQCAHCPTKYIRMQDLLRHERLAHSKGE